MERSLHYFRLFPGTEARFDGLHAQISEQTVADMHAAGLHDVTVFRRGTDAWR